MTVWV